MNKKILPILLTLSFLVVSTQTHAETYSDAHQKVQALFKSDEEKTAKDGDSMRSRLDIFQWAAISEYATPLRQLQAH